jgi:hypothetical protein
MSAAGTSTRLRKNAKPVPQPPVLDMARVRAAVEKRTLDLARIAQAVSSREKPERIEPERHHGLLPVDGSLRKRVARLAPRQCVGFHHGSFLRHC